MGPRRGSQVLASRRQILVRFFFSNQSMIYTLNEVLIASFSLCTSQCHFLVIWFPLDPIIPIVLFEFQFVLCDLALCFAFRFAHIPHLWQRSTLADIARVLAPWLAPMRRRNRVRNRYSDLSIHLQYESYLQRLSDLQSANHRRVVRVDARKANQRGRPLYQYVTYGSETKRLPNCFFIVISVK